MEPAREPRDLTIHLFDSTAPRVQHAARWIMLDTLDRAAVPAGELAVEAARARAHLRLASLLTG